MNFHELLFKALVLEEMRGRGLILYSNFNATVDFFFYKTDISLFIAAKKKQFSRSLAHIRHEKQGRERKRERYCKFYYEICIMTHRKSPALSTTSVL